MVYVRAAMQIDLVRPKQPHETHLDTSSELRSPGVPIPMYRDLRIGLPHSSRLAKRWRHSRPDLVHVATEGPLGWAAIRAARANGIPVTSDFRTNFDLYSEHYGFGWLRGIVGGYLKHFHNSTDRTFVPTSAVSNALTQQGYQRTEVVGRGVDAESLFACTSPARNYAPAGARTIAARCCYMSADSRPKRMFRSHFVRSRLCARVCPAYGSL